MKRWLAVSIGLAFLAGCAGSGSGVTSFLPAPGANNAVRAGAGMGARSDAHRPIERVEVKMRIPRRHRGEREPLHPASISSATQSVSIAVNASAPVIFNATPQSPNCSIGAGGTTCTFVVSAPAGTDTFVVSTYSGPSGTGTLLDSGTAVVNIVKGVANAPRITLGPVVSTTADSGMGSLRYAVGTASPGDTVMFILPAGSLLTVSKPITLNTSVSIAGPGVTASARPHRNRHGMTSNVTFSGLTISGGGTQQIFVVSPGVTATISGLILTQGLATTSNQPGGAVYNQGTLTLASDALTENGSNVSSPYARTRHHAERARHARHNRPQEHFHPNSCSTTNYFGGAVYNHGTMAIVNTNFDSNVLTSNFFPSGTHCQYSYGGAVYNDEYGTLSVTGSVFTNNSAYYGGAVYNNSSYGSAVFSGDTFSFNTGCTATTGCAVSGCSGTGCTSYPEGYGAAIYDGNGGGITVTNSSFSYNSVGGVAQYSDGQGGALYLSAGNPSVTGSTFTNNLAGGGTSNCSYGEGGAIFEDASNTLELDNDTFTGNEAGGDYYGYGGAVYNDNEADKGSGNSFRSNTAFGGGSTCTSAHDGEAYGGAIYADYGISMSTSSFTANFATCNYYCVGGAIYEGDPSNLTSDTFSSNAAVASGANSAPDAEVYGGAIYASGILRLTGSTFTSNGITAQSAVGYEAYGGAIYSDDNFVSNGNTFTSNSATIPNGSGPTYLYGGATYTDSNFTSNGDSYTSNYVAGAGSAYGGALSIDSTASVNGAKFISNSAAVTNGSAYGGALDIESSSVIANSTFAGNTSTSTSTTGTYDQGGGAVYDDGGSTLNGLKITGNTAFTGSGGGVLVGSSTETINASLISGNAASQVTDYGGGGGVYGYETVLILNSTISGNGVSVAGGTGAGGGGFYNDNPGGTLQGSTVNGNAVTGFGTHVGGGGVFNYVDSGSYIDDTITGNSSNGDGGGFESYGNAAMFLTNVTLYANSTAGNGGNLFNDNSTSPYVTIANSILAGGTAAGTGADVDNTGTLVSNNYNIFGTAPAGGGTFTLQSKDLTTPITLGALTNNGGPTFTRSDAVTPAAGYIPWSSAAGGTCGNVTGINVDQRGYALGPSTCDVGAFDLTGTPGAGHLHVPAPHGPHKPGHHRRAHPHPDRH
ncbi:MAG: hypothetical protein JO192_00465 [Candidatus Eremiobacteraeota bacterium]|nr:hypothetical protein [Candidatus Eremiobacteraeota bacterium]